MLKYIYNAKQRDGSLVKGEIEASDTNDFLIKLKDMQLYCISYKIIDDFENHSNFKMKGKDLVLFSRQMSVMLSAGVSVVRAVDILYEKSENQRMKDSYRRLYERLQQGRELSYAMDAEGNTFPKLLIRMIRSGEISGSLDTTLERMADHYEKENKLSNKIKNAMLYPKILCGVCIVVVIAVITFILPSFFQLYEGQALPLPTQIMIWISDFITSKWYILIVAAVAVYLFWIWFKRIPAVRFKLDHLKLVMPIFGKLNKTILSSRFANTFATLYASGVNVIEILEICSDILDNTWITDCFKRIITRVSNGEYMSTAIGAEDIFEPMLMSMLFIGEESGRLDEILNKAADFYDEEANAATEKMVSMIEPMLIIVMGVVVCFIIVAIMLPMYGMLDNVS